MIRQFIRAIWQTIIRTFAFISKEARLILHQPRLLFSVVLGPFLILLLFGVGYRNAPRTLDTLYVVPEGSQIEAQVESYADSFGETIESAGISRDAAEADERLRSREVDLVVVTPRDPVANWENDEQATLSLYHYEIDPYESQYVQVLGQRYAEAINREILRTAISQSQEKSADWQENVDRAQIQATSLRQALAAGNALAARSSAEDLKTQLDLLALGMGAGLTVVGGLEQATGRSDTVERLLAEVSDLQTTVDEDLSDIEEDSALEEGEATAAEVEESLNEVDELLTTFRDMDPSVLVAPFRSESLSITEIGIEPMHFYVPGVIALLLQQLAVTLAGLSIIQEKLGGAMELFRAAPASALEILSGKYVSFLLLIGILAAVLTALIVLGLRVPQLGSWLNYASIVLALLLTSLGLGFHISLSARSNSQAIQYSMLLLLASIFFSGFFMALYRLAPFLRVLSWTLPATYATVLLQDVMLRGQSPRWLLLLGLYAYGFILLILASYRLRRLLRPE